MTDHTFRKTLAELKGQIDELPPDRRAPLLHLLQETITRQKEIEASKASSLDALDDWRLSLKYAIFDAEAARREGPQRAN